MNVSHLVVTIIFLVIALYLQNLLFPVHSQDFSIPPPWPLFVSTVILSEKLRWLADHLLPPPIKVFNDASGMWKMQIIYSCGKLGISDWLVEGPKTTEELAKLADVANSMNLLRLLRAAEAYGYFTQDLKTGLWRNTLYSRLIGTKHPNSQKDMIATLVEDGWAMWSQLYESIKEDSPLSQYEIIHGKTLWQTFENDPRREAQFARAMSNADSITWYSLVHDYDWGKFKRVVDIGGSLGSFTFHLLEKYTSLHGAIFDRPEVIEKTKIIWNSNHSHLLSRTNFFEGSFFDASSLPSFHDGDVILMRAILHDWNDKEALSILSNLRIVMGNLDITLVIVDVVLNPHDLIPPKYLLDLHMHVFAKGKERYLDQWKELLDQAGFQFIHNTMSRNTYDLITARVK